MTRRLFGAAALGLALVLSGCSPAAPPAETTAPPPASPLAGVTLFLDPESVAQRQVDDLLGQGRAAEAEALSPISSQPVASWFAAQNDDPYAGAERVTTAAAAQGQLPVLVAYHPPGRDCGSYSAGGSPDQASYLEWVGRFAAGVGERPALVVLEPDALAQAVGGDCRGAEDSAAELAMLGQAVDVLKKQPNVTVYVDAGHAGWIDDPAIVADALRASGVERADGFSLNVSNFQGTEESVAYGERLSGLLGGRTQFVVDVSRNGQGAPEQTDGIDAWCNPPGAGLGENPRVVEGPALAIAFLWVKEPGASDGNCRPGEPAAGVFWPDYADRLIAQRG